MTAGRCPPSTALARAASLGAGEPLRAHLDGCRRCVDEWRTQVEMAELGRQMTHERPSVEQRQSVRAALLAAALAPRHGRLRWRLPALVLVAAAGVLVAWARSRPSPSPPVAARAAAGIMALPGARFERLSGPPEEVVRLEEGTIEVTVEPATRGETFRVVTAEGEVEVRGTIFETTAAGGKLVAVRVKRGRVLVKHVGGHTTSLDAGREWKHGPETPRLMPARRRGPPVLAPLAVKAQATMDPAERAFVEGVDLLKAGDASRAAASFERAAQLAPAGPLVEDARYWHAVALAQSGAGPEARQGLETFLDRFPRSARAAEASVMLGWLFLESGDRAEAEARFRAALHDRSRRVRGSARRGLAAATGEPVSGSRRP